MIKGRPGARDGGRAERPPGLWEGDRAGRGSGNSRIGSTPKTVATEVDDIGLDQPPRDQSSTFSPALVCPRAPAFWAGWKT